MKLSILCHACVHISIGKTSLIFDPWLSGCEYWSSWWHWPEPRFQNDIFSSDVIVITHGHADHFHPPTLKRFSRDVMVIIPKFPVPTLRLALEELGFNRIHEIPHNKSFEVGPGIKLYCHQTEVFDDCVYILQGEGNTIVNLNDAKPLPSSWKWLRTNFPSVTFALKSCSPAWSYPTRFQGPSDQLEPVVERSTYLQAFHSVARKLKPKFMIPFASGVRHAHRELLNENDHLISSAEVEAFMKANPLEGVSTISMPAGSSWDSNLGFQINQTEPPNVPEEYFIDLYREEDEATVEPHNLDKYFTDLFRSLGPLVWAIREKWEIRWKEKEKLHSVGIDFRSRKIEKSPTNFNSTAVIEVHPWVLNAALKNKAFGNIDISKRWRVQLNSARAESFLFTLQIINLYEYGALKTSNILSLRALACRLARWRECADYLSVGVRLLTSGSNRAIDKMLGREI